MRITKILLVVSAIIFAVIGFSNPVNAIDNDRTVIYFKETTCSSCAKVAGYMQGWAGDYTEDEDYLLQMENAGITVITYDIMANPDVPEFSYVNDDGITVIPTALDVFAAFNRVYGRQKSTVPVVFAGEYFFQGDEEIKAAFDAGTIYDFSSNPIKDVSVSEGEAYTNLKGILGFFTVLGAGLLDGFNPCAIALLLLFVSLLGFTEDKKVLILVSVVYIGALFISYYLIGRFFMSAIIKYQSQLSIVSNIINWFVLLLCLFLFIFNFHDYIKAKNDDYGNIKNQLPKWLQRFNKKIVKAFTGVINSENRTGLVSVLALTFVLGITLSVTELVCTGQIYFGILYGITTLDSVYANLLLLVYNLMFVLPLIIIAVVSVRMKNIMSVSNWIREHMKHIKFANAMLFLFISIYFMSRISLFNTIFEGIKNIFS